MRSQGKQDSRTDRRLLRWMNKRNMHWTGGCGGLSCGGLDQPYMASWFECLDWWCHILSEKAENIYHSHNGTFFGEQGKRPSWSRMTRARNRLKALVFIVAGGGAKVSVPMGWSLHALTFPPVPEEGVPRLFYWLAQIWAKGRGGKRGWKLSKHQTSW